MQVVGPSPERVADLMAQIERHLEANPFACDSAEGIARWWIRDAGAAVPEVSAALDRLVRLGRLERLQRHGCETFRAIHPT